MSSTKCRIHSGALLIHFLQHSSIVMFCSSTSLFLWSPCVRTRIVYFKDLLPSRVVTSLNACASSPVNRELYLATNKKASNPFGASAKILLTSVKIFSWSSRAWLKRGTAVQPTVAVYRTPGVSITEIERSRDLCPCLHSRVTAEPSALDSKSLFPMIVFPVALFPLPVFPRRTTVSSLPLGS